MNIARVSYLALALAAGLLFGCGSGGGSSAGGPCKGAADGAPCGDAASSVCDGADTCLAGECVQNLAPRGTPCGDTTSTACNGADTCDGAGACDAHLAADGTSCYDCAAGPGLCAACAAGTCASATACAEAAPALFTTKEGGNAHQGNMFDLHAIHTVTITGFDVLPDSSATVELYYKVGPWSGYETTPDAWTLIGSAPVTSTGDLVRVPVAVDVTIPAGETYAFYVTSTSVDMNLRYTNGTVVGAVFASDANLEFLEGAGLGYPFGGGFEVNTPRVWNGNIHYVPVISTIDGDYEGGVADGVMFDVSASARTLLRGDLQVELAAGTHDVDVYFRRGSFVGFEGSSAGWVRVGGGRGIVAAGGGALTALPIEGGLLLEAGQVGALYVDTHGAGLRTSPGTAVGDVVTTSGSLTIGVGRAIDSSFGGVGPAAAFRGSFQEPVCE